MSFVYSEVKAMLVFISDLHFQDKKKRAVDNTNSSYNPNVPKSAFDIFLGEIAGTANRLIGAGKKIEEIKIIFLGDIFDILRSEKWFSVAEDETPWGRFEAKTEKHANDIFDGIIAENTETFALLSSELKDRYHFPVEPERIYIPGNHDRLCNKYESLRKKARKALGIADRNTPFEHEFSDVRYSVLARHGHEYDKFNFEGGKSFQLRDYMRVPIGDPITTELVTRFPWKMMQTDEVKALSEDEQEALRRNLLEIENVRPFTAMIEWLLYQVKSHLDLKDVIEDTVDEIVQDFHELTYVKKWYKHHDRWFNFMDEADKIQSILYLLGNFKLFSSEKMLPLLEKVKGYFVKDDLLEASGKETMREDNCRPRYVVYGHTHSPLQAALNITGEGIDNVYLNTGTWRTRYYRCKEGSGFIGWKNLTYLTFYTKKERGTEFPAFETWTGTLKTV
jgi:UDP-2,3-diacylglucosamine pyrophosphatase LpxH